MQEAPKWCKLGPDNTAVNISDNACCQAFRTFNDSARKCVRGKKKVLRLLTETFYTPEPSVGTGITVTKRIKRKWHAWPTRYI